MAHCGSSEPNTTVQARPECILQSQANVDQSMKPVLFEIFGEIWTVQSRLGQGVSASVYRVSSGRAATAAVKEFQADIQGGDYGYHKERSVLEDIQGHKNIVTLYGVFTNHSCMGVATRCLLLELLDVSVSELLVRGNSGTQAGRLKTLCARCREAAPEHIRASSSSGDFLKGRCPAGFPTLPDPATTDHLDQVCSVKQQLTDTPGQGNQQGELENQQGQRPLRTGAGHPCFNIECKGEILVKDDTKVPHSRI